MQSLNRVHNNLTNLHHDYNPSYVPIKREDYHWLIDSSSCQSTPYILLYSVQKAIDMNKYFLPHHIASTVILPSTPLVFPCLNINPL